MNWPHEFWEWFDFFAVLFFAAFMLDKARLMYVRSTYRDRLGWSLIATNTVVGIAYVFGALVLLDTHRFYNSPEHKVIRLVGVSVITWTWVVMRRAKPTRINKAMGEGHVR